MRILTGSVEVQHVGPAKISGPQSLTRTPMTVEAILNQPGVSGYRPPSEPQPWLDVRLQDGCWIRVRPVDEFLDYYHLEPICRNALRAGIREELLPVWAAFIWISRAAMTALERAVAEGTVDPPAVEDLAEDETGSYIPIERIDHRPAGIRTLDRYAKRFGSGSPQELCLSAGFGA